MCCQLISDEIGVIDKIKIEANNKIIYFMNSFLHKKSNRIPKKKMINPMDFICNPIKRIEATQRSAITKYSII